MRFATLSAIVSTAALLGCATGPLKTPPATPLTLPSNWSAHASPPPPTATSPSTSPSTAPTDSTATPTALAQWWQRFNDPQLSALVLQALEANTSVEVARAALQQSRALRDVQNGQQAVRVQATGSAQRSTTAASGTGNAFKAGLDASWEPDIFGRQARTLQATEADAQAAATSLADVQVSVAAEVALAYIQLRSLQTQLGIARANLASQQETWQLTDWRAQAGLTTSLEVEQALTLREQTAAQIPALLASLAKTRHGLAVLTGQTPDALQALAQTPQAMPQVPTDLALGIPAQTLRQRPDVRTAEHRITAALARVSAADAARYPSFSLGGSVGLSALTLASLGSGATVANALLASVSAPLLDGGAALAQVEAQQAALAQARGSYRATVLSALQDVEDALVALQGDRDSLVALQAAATAAENAALLARQRYASGLIDFQTVLQTQRTLLSTQLSATTLLANIGADHVRLYKALGGGWQ